MTNPTVNLRDFIGKTIGLPGNTTIQVYNPTTDLSYDVKALELATMEGDNDIDTDPDAVTIQLVIDE